MIECYPRSLCFFIAVYEVSTLNIIQDATVLGQNL